MVSTRKALPTGTRTRRQGRPTGARRSKTRLIDLSGPKLYAIISYRVAMAVITLIALIYTQH